MTMDSIETPKRHSIYIVGCGSVGTALALRLQASGHELVGAHCRTQDSARRASAHLGLEVSHGAIDPDTLIEASVLFVAVPDPKIRPVAEDLARREGLKGEQVVFHCSGARNAVELEPLRHMVSGVGSFHPLLSFVDPVAAADLLKVASFALEGDEAALSVAEELVASMGGRALHVKAADRVLYHAAAATASNHLVALAAGAASSLEPLGIGGDEALKALIPLMKSTLTNLERLGLPRALTGPVSRGDSDCIRGHLAAIEKRAPKSSRPIERWPRGLSRWLVSRRSPKRGRWKPSGRCSGE